jgi:hypothetical protein
MTNNSREASSEKSSSRKERLAPTDLGGERSENSSGKDGFVGESVEIVYNMNGNVIDFSNEAMELVRAAIPGDTPLYPTVSLLSPNTRVVSFVTITCDTIITRSNRCCNLLCYISVVSIL